MSKNEKLYMLMAFTGNAIFGFSFLFSKLALDIAEPLVLLAVRFSVAFILMNILYLFKLVDLKLKGKDLKPLIVLGLMQPVLYFICESYGIKLSSSSFAGIIISLAPIAGLILAYIFLKERMSLKQIIYSIVSVLGVIIISYNGELGGTKMLGLLFLLGAVFFGSMFSVQSRKIANDYTAFERTYVMFMIGMIVFVPMALIKTGFNSSLWLVPLSNLQFWISIIYLSCISSVGAFMLLNKALDVLPASRSLVFANVTSVISVLAGVIILKEAINLIQVIGIVLVLIGVYKVNQLN
ncbi:MAG: DMT family transporter [Erysipelotrichaceae bacterium]|nr:DMT family transporter [Erysipelotrichaceae bacterium]